MAHVDEEAFTQSDEQVFCTISIQIETLLDRATDLLLTTNDRTVRPRTPSKIKVVHQSDAEAVVVLRGMLADFRRSLKTETMRLLKVNNSIQDISKCNGASGFLSTIVISTQTPPPRSCLSPGQVSVSILVTEVSLCM